MKQRGWVALLRAINLGARNKVPMAELRALFETNGCESVRSYIQSGNVLFRSASSDRTALARRFEGAVEEAFGVSTSVVLRTFDEIARVVATHPFGRDPSKTQVAFLTQRPAPDKVRSLKRLDISPDRIEVAGSDVFLHYPGGVRGARLTGARLERHLGVPATIRNWRTVTRLAELAHELETI